MSIPDTPWTEEMQAIWDEARNTWAVATAYGRPIPEPRTWPPALSGLLRLCLYYSVADEAERRAYHETVLADMGNWKARVAAAKGSHLGINLNELDFKL